MRSFRNDAHWWNSCDHQSSKHRVPPLKYRKHPKPIVWVSKGLAHAYPNHCQQTARWILLRGIQPGFLPVMFNNELSYREVFHSHWTHLLGGRRSHTWLLSALLPVGPSGQEGSSLFPLILETHIADSSTAWPMYMSLPCWESEVVYLLCIVA